jgi:hypothetical protein
MTLIPASKREKVEQQTIDLIAKLDVSNWIENRAGRQQGRRIGRAI